MNIYESYLQRVRDHGEEPAIVDPAGADISFAETNTAAKRITAWLTNRGIEIDDRVAIYLPDCHEYIPSVLGVLRKGAVAVPVNTRLSPEELQYVLNDVRPRALIAPSMDDTVDSLVKETETLTSGDCLSIRPNQWFKNEELPKSHTAPPPTTRLDSNPAFVMHTSGTTGKPKGVIQTHRNVAAQVAGGISKFQLTSTDIGLATVPLFHVGGFHEIVLMTLFAGGAVAIQSSWDPVEWANLVETTGATWSGLIPTMIIDILDSKEALDRDTSSLRFCIYGGSATPESVLKDFEDRTEVGMMIDNYGQTENSGVSVTYSLDDERRPGAMGTFVPVVEGRVVDLETGEELPPGQEGELLLRGDSITPGYWERPKANEELFTDGWLHTEDVVQMDKDGYLYYVDRVDDMILSGGEKVSPSEVEDVLQEHPNVSAVAVLGTSHERFGKAVTAVIIPQDDSLTTEDVKAFCDERDDLAGYKKPRRVVFVEDFPQTGSHKVDKDQLVEQLAQKYSSEWR